MPRFVFFALLIGCSSSADYYEACEKGSDCVSDTECWTIAWEAGADGKMCSATCSSDSDCPRGGGCWELVGDPTEGQRICYERCSRDADCPTGFLCANAEMDDPDNPGMGVVVDQICLPE